MMQKFIQWLNAQDEHGITRNDKAKILLYVIIIISSMVFAIMFFFSFILTHDWVYVIFSLIYIPVTFWAFWSINKYVENNKKVIKSQ